VGGGLQAETEYLIEDPVGVTCLGGEPIEFLLSGALGGPTVGIVGEMEHNSETSLTSQGLTAQWRHRRSEPLQGPVPVELVDGFRIRAKYREKIEIKSG
jgi:hypothetical protein